MIEFHKIWIDQCEAARDIREGFGPEKAIGYLSSSPTSTTTSPRRRPQTAPDRPRPSPTTPPPPGNPRPGGQAGQRSPRSTATAARAAVRSEEHTSELH